MMERKRNLKVMIMQSLNNKYKSNASKKKEEIKLVFGSFINLKLME